jgi:RNA polymerase sigma-70 factor (ECF subfamily)
VPTTEAEFSALAERHRRELHVHCYRMLGSFDEAEDLVQETFLRAWRKADDLRDPATVRAWLYRIATNACLDALDGRSRRALPHDVDPDAGEIAWLQPYPDPADVSISRETIELAFLAAIQHLPPRQRAALILRDVLGFRAREAASTLGTTPASVNSALIRARANLHVSEPEAGDERLRDAVEGFVAALSRGDVDTLVGIAADTTLSDERSWAYSPAPVY